ncbi:hypothetical protein FHG89_31625 [Micromonospora orduensis]|uniref:Uncharacterized protein n=2 Tax=Micromonospora orduensis TaxID=1420891 RepID=A0A5C4Q9G1_9ACTN|nr:hypothetical protein FHG89_31625 [Micromonospora orduensis]
MQLFKPATYWKRLDDMTPSFVIEGLIHSDATMITGKPKAGKTNLTARMVSAIANQEETFLGKKVNQHGNVMIVCTDPGEAKKWGRRSFHYGCDSRVFVADFACADWNFIVPEVTEMKPALFVFDNILGATEGNSNQAEGANEVLMNLDKIIANGVPVVALHHSGKDYMDYTPRGPMGHTKYAAWMRHNVDVLKSGDQTLNLGISGNDTPEMSMSVSVKYQGDSLTATYDLLTEEIKKDKRVRGEDTHLKRRGLLDEVNSNPAFTGLKSKAAVGKKLYENFPGQYESADAARMAFSRAATGASYAEGKGWN